MLAGAPIIDHQNLHAAEDGCDKRIRQPASDVPQDGTARSVRETKHVAHKSLGVAISSRFRFPELPHASDKTDTTLLSRIPRPDTPIKELFQHRKIGGPLREARAQYKTHFFQRGASSR